MKDEGERMKDAVPQENKRLHPSTDLLVIYHFSYLICHLLEQEIIRTFFKWNMRYEK